LEFERGLISDHRMLWIDVQVDSTILGTSEIPLWKPMARRLKCNDPRLVERYKHAEYPQFFSKVLQTATTTISNNHQSIHQELKAQLDYIDDIRTKGILWADRHCRKLKMGSVPWSPVIQQCMDKIKYYNTCRLRFEFGHNL
jgi:hypothetical protein